MLLLWLVLLLTLIVIKVIIPWQNISQHLFKNSSYKSRNVYIVSVCTVHPEYSKYTMETKWHKYDDDIKAVKTVILV